MEKCFFFSGDLRYFKNEKWYEQHFLFLPSFKSSAHKTNIIKPFWLFLGKIWGIKNKKIPKVGKNGEMGFFSCLCKIRQKYPWKSCQHVIFGTFKTFLFKVSFIFLQSSQKNFKHSVWKLRSRTFKKWCSLSCLSDLLKWIT